MSKGPTVYREELSSPKRRIRKTRPSYKRRSYETLVDEVRDHITEDDSPSFTVESVSFTLRARPGLVKKVFYQMVREGLIHKPVNRPPHDVSRGGMRRGWSGWRASSWMKRRGDCSNG